MIRNILIALLVILVISIIVMMRFAGRITKPLQELTEAAKQLNEGNYEFKVEYNKKDEVGMLTDTFCSMRDRIKAQFEELSEGKMRLQVALKDAEQANRAKTSFLSNMSHEIRTPMNAIKFTEAPGSVSMTVERTAEFEDQSTLRFCIRDTGIGMDKEYIPRIFDAFSQEDSSKTNKYGSTGLGMAITKRIVEMMNGTISVESEKGVGTEFTVVVTLKNGENHNESLESMVDRNKIRVLIVDDDEISAEHERVILDEAGIHADICLSGQEALHMLEVRHIKQEPYNLVLMDWKMPEMDGLEATRKIRDFYSRGCTMLPAGRDGRTSYETGRA